MDGFGKEFYGCILVLIVMLLISTPLGIWKLIEIISWLIKNVHFGIGK